MSDFEPTMEQSIADQAVLATVSAQQTSAQDVSTGGEVGQASQTQAQVASASAAEASQDEGLSPQESSGEGPSAEVPASQEESQEDDDPQEESSGEELPQEEADAELREDLNNNTPLIILNGPSEAFSYRVVSSILDFLNPIDIRQWREDSQGPTTEPVYARDLAPPILVCKTFKGQSTANLETNLRMGNDRAGKKTFWFNFDGGNDSETEERIRRGASRGSEPSSQDLATKDDVEDCDRRFRRLHFIQLDIKDKSVDTVGRDVMGTTFRYN